MKNYYVLTAKYSQQIADYCNYQLKQIYNCSSIIVKPYKCIDVPMIIEQLLKKHNYNYIIVADMCSSKELNNLYKLIKNNSQINIYIINLTQIDLTQLAKLKQVHIINNKQDMFNKITKLITNNEDK